jgi:hypothetical protein
VISGVICVILVRNVRKLGGAIALAAVLWQSWAAVGSGLGGGGRSRDRVDPLEPLDSLRLALPFHRHPAPLAQGTPTAPWIPDAATLREFEAIAFGGEFSRDRGLQVIRKWATDLRVAITGRPTQADLETLERTLADLNGLIAPRRIRLDRQSANVTIHFVPTTEFRRIEPHYVEGNRGFFFVWWNGRSEITRSRILIATDGITQPERSHLIREELTQSLGLMNDSWSDPASTFYQGWTATATYTDRDRALIRLLYDPRIQPGMNRRAVRAAIASP